MHRLFYLFLLIFFAPDIFAGPFDPVPTDKSVSILGIVFGSNVGDIYLGGTANTMLPALIEKFNFIVVVVGLIIVSYVSIMSVINTAQEGTAMGKKWSAVWVPLRSVIGMALMVPGPATGYSMIQITIMWIVLQGIGAADTLWGIALDQLLSGPTGGLIVDEKDPNIKKMATVETILGKTPETVSAQVLNAAVCMETAYKLAKEEHNRDTWIGDNGSYLQMFAEQTPNTPTISDTSSTTSGYVYFGRKGTTNEKDKAVCGKFFVDATINSSEYTGLVSDISIINAQTLAKASQEAYDTKVLAISTVYTVLKPLAQGIVDGSIKVSNPSYPPGYKYNAINAYATIMQALVIPESQNTAVEDKQKEIFEDAIKKGKSYGWISAGAFYFILNQSPIHAVLYATAKQGPQSNTTDGKSSYNSIPNCDTTAICKTDDSGSRIFETDPADRYAYFLSINDDKDLLANNLYIGNQYLANDIKGGVSLRMDLPSIDGNQNEFVSVLADAMQELTITILESVQNLVSSTNIDPLYAHALLGQQIMMACEGLVFVLFGVAFGLAVLGATPFIGPVFTNLGDLVKTIGTMFALFLAVVWTLGATLAIYCPLIPFMIFTVGVLGWLLTVIEAIVAGPIIALGLVMPHGDELGKLENALNILTNIFLRPMLMIIGFILAGKVYAAIVTFVDYGMLGMFETIKVQTMFSVVIVLAAYVTFITSITSTAFSLINAIPDKILRWIGGGQENSPSAGDVMGRTEGAVGKSAGEISSTNKTGLEQAGAIKKLDKDKDEANPKGAKDTDGGGKDDGGGKKETPPANTPANNATPPANSGTPPASGGTPPASGGTPSTGSGQTNT